MEPGPTVVQRFLLAFYKRRRWLLPLGAAAFLPGLLVRTIVGAAVYVTLFVALFVVYVASLREGMRQDRARLILGPTLGFTREGFYFTIIAIVTAFAAIQSGANLLYAMLGMMLSALGVNFVASGMNLHRITVERTAPRIAYAMSYFLVKLRFRNEKKRVTTYAVSVRDAALGDKPGLVYLGAVGPGETVTGTYSTVVSRRGLHRFGSVRLESTFPFLFFRKVVEVPCESEVLVYPRMGEIARGLLPGARPRELVVGAEAGDMRGRSRFYGLREYRAGEDPKLIHWRSSARLGKPLIKQMENEDTRQIWIILDNMLTDPDDAETLDRFERGVSFAATLARDLVAAEFQVGLMFAASEFRPVPVRGGTTHLQYILRELALVGPADGVRFDEFASQAAKTVARGCAAYAVLADDMGSKAAILHRALGPVGGVSAVSVGSPAFERTFQL